MNDDASVTVIRPSSLTAWADCARRAAANLFRREIQDAGYDLKSTVHNVAASVGTATHAGAASILEEKMAGRLGAGTITAAEHTALESFAVAMGEGLAFDATSPNRNTAERQIVRMTRCFHQHLTPVIDPISVEERLEVDAGDGFVVSGQSDNVTMEPGRVRDLKTGVISRTHAAQLGAYAIIQHTHGREVGGAMVDFIKRVALAKDQPPPVTTDYRLGDIVPVAMNRIQRIKREVAEWRHRLEVGGQARGHQRDLVAARSPVPGMLGRARCRPGARLDLAADVALDRSDNQVPPREERRHRLRETRSLASARRRGLRRGRHPGDVPAAQRGVGPQGPDRRSADLAGLRQPHRHHRVRVAGTGR